MAERPKKSGACVPTGSRLAAGVLVLAIGCLTAGCSDDDALAGLVAQAEFATRAGDARAAAVYYGTAAAKAPKDDFVRWQLAKTLLTVRDGAAAEKAIRAAAALGVDDQRTRPALAEALFLQAKYGELADLGIDGLSKTPAAIVLAYQARAQLELGQIESAERLLQRAAKLSRYTADVAFAEAELALSRGDYRLAREELHNTRLLEPAFPYAAARLGEIDLAQGDAASAERDFSEAFEQRFGPWRDLLGRGIARLQQGKIEPALQDANTLLASSPASADVQLFAYQVYALKGDVDRARQALDAAIAQLEADSSSPAAAEILEKAIAIRGQDPATVNPLDIDLSPRLGRAATTTVAEATKVSPTARAPEPELAQTAQRPEEPASAMPDAPATDVEPQDGPAAMAEVAPVPAGESGAPRTAELAAAEAELIALQRAAESLEAEQRLLRSNLGGDGGEGQSPPQGLNTAALPQASPEGGRASSTPAQQPNMAEQQPAVPADPQASVGDAHADDALEAAAVIEKPVEEAPASPAAEIEAFVRHWAAAWSRQDVDDYLSHYAIDFLPADGSSRIVWAAQRRERLTRPKSISVEISDLQITALDDGRARVGFEQAYRASHYQDQVDKTLELTREDGAWKIVREVNQR